MKVLFISYDGMTDNLGQSQVIPYLIGFNKAGFEITLISFEKEERFKKDATLIKQLLEANNIDWHPIKYKSTFPILSGYLNVVSMKKKAFELHQLKNFDIVHGRSYVASSAALDLKLKKGVAFVFDMRGFWADEKVDGMLWDLKNPIHRFAYLRLKTKERQYLKNANQIVSLTYEGKREINSWKNFKQKNIEVIPCCADLNHFSINNVNTAVAAQFKQELKLENTFVLAYLGSIGTWYLLTEMLQFFKQLLKIKPTAKFLFITSDDKKMIIDEAIKIGITAENIVVTHCARAKLPSLLSICNASVFFIRQAFSKKGSSPTKMGELMGMNIPIVCNSGVGDVEQIIEEAGNGVAVSGFDDIELYNAALKLVEISKNPESKYDKAVVEKYFDLATGTNKFIGCYYAAVQTQS